eukprot:gnl/TRDRNA2_/TRDRNA2_133458_c0_seq1.p2 gnl/TRDRNA2_/TRDRNA2_133458_c0~~gnl/TRDRNA2_/TRDRNA2_133458_c0_seq1.p2  ORF type:complete len:113 (-),score=13.83 gnl/TRDRNA2_/TRDRNA2_133458_c0_seq1:146-484(-)
MAVILINCVFQITDKNTRCGLKIFYLIVRQLLHVKDLEAILIAEIAYPLNDRCGQNDITYWHVVSCMVRGANSKPAVSANVSGLLSVHSCLPFFHIVDVRSIDAASRCLLPL